MPEISATGIVLDYGAHRAIDGIDFFIPHGSFTTLLGPSGCGKTTTLRMLAGFERPNQGSIRIGDRVVVDASRSGVFVPPQGRQLGVVFQSYALWPHMTVFQQVAYPLVARRVPKAAIRQKVAAALNTVKLPNFASQLPSQLSGGQQQRVALAR
ncbi:MAG: ABC transporter ATP-binding protein, partial [Candidatus Hydrogenedentales bacterium]